MSDNGGSLPQQQPQKPIPPESGRYPITVSAPAIHYTTAQYSRAIIHPETMFFVAYNASYTKFIMHPIRLKDKLSFYEPRPLYRDNMYTAQGSISIFDLLVQEFSDDPPALHLIQHVRPSHLGLVSESAEIKDFRESLFALSNRLPVIPLSVRSVECPPPPPNSTGAFRTLALTRELPDQGPLFIDGFLVRINDRDAA
ncbi:hypothetical protein ANO11243_071730 [Dothideomycetidae sp. 11243]|nr:hypothetical protein ANO11243_071730 [fungal sp. No.11243]